MTTLVSEPENLKLIGAFWNADVTEGVDMDVARLFNMSVRTIQSWIARGQIRGKNRQ